MSEKRYTILISNHKRGRSRSFVISESWIKASAILIFCGFILFLCGVVDYTGLLFKVARSEQLFAENENLRQQYQAMEGKVSNLETALERVHNFTHKIKSIMSVEDQHRLTKLLVQEPKRDLASELSTGEVMTSEGQTTPLENDELAKHDPEEQSFTLSVRIDRALKSAELREQSVLDVWNLVSDRQSLWAATPTVKPAQGWYTSRFGFRIDPFTGRTAYHSGVDIAAAPGTPVYAPADGVVSYVGYEPGYGRIISIDHGYGVITRYGHNSRVYVEMGQRVARGDVITAVGSTGRSSGPHVHYEVRVEGVPVNPQKYILFE